ncbi:type II toxin-antitoxin system HigB family toxin [Pedobacter sp. MC2016-05]|uniref:type II toxin-antitoxin system HigB family toxin n=1 Tax=Pedobacter sp. MC2016-05 TaxID=2994474 RepID=UPI00224765A7|nr:type II toxin-antitoxin system HigB family toxin [Pedobacter sp. MC2016-05]MCX2474372.1 type II toxin-antitoxin system HigB family toxin [Pedobacter sp. MC2016-05]
MNVIAKGTLLHYIAKYPLAEHSILAWLHDFEKYTFDNFNQLKEVYKNASLVANNRIVFNIKGNDYRLVISMNFKRKAAYIIWFGTHSQYDKIDVSIIAFDINLALKKK